MADHARELLSCQVLGAEPGDGADERGGA
jgi:hypothetical protein